MGDEGRTRRKFYCQGTRRRARGGGPAVQRQRSDPRQEPSLLPLQTLPTRIGHGVHIEPPRLEGDPDPRLRTLTRKSEDRGTVNVGTRRNIPLTPPKPPTLRRPPPYGRVCTRVRTRRRGEGPPRKLVDVSGVNLPPQEVGWGATSSSGWDGCTLDSKRGKLEE